MQLWDELSDLPPNILDKWIFGLGHGILPNTPEYNVKRTVEFIKKNYVY
jgi:uroporphyrinogen-III decarboxylase